MISGDAWEPEGIWATISGVARHPRQVGKPQDELRTYELDVVHKLGHDNFFFLKHEQKLGPEEFPWLP